MLTVIGDGLDKRTGEARAGAQVGDLRIFGDREQLAVVFIDASEDRREATIQCQPGLKTLQKRPVRQFGSQRAAVKAYEFAYIFRPLARVQARINQRRAWRASLLENLRL